MCLNGPAQRDRGCLQRIRQTACVWSCTQQENARQNPLVLHGPRPAFRNAPAPRLLPPNPDFRQAVCSVRFHRFWKRVSVSGVSVLSSAGSASLPEGFRACGRSCGIKPSGRSDLALFVSDTAAAAAGVFTTNRVLGAPVMVSQQRVPAGDIRAVVINSGNANACTGDRGIQDAQAMTASVARQIGCRAEQVLVCSTGIIGVPLPVDRITAAIGPAVKDAGTDDADLMAAAEAMMTTDTFPKLVSRDVAAENGTVRVAGAAKGAAMIAPNMATMLAVVMTDAVLTPPQCDELLREATARTFNCIRVDGHMSTSDTVLLLAGGSSGVAAADMPEFREAVTDVCEKLATDIVRDAEGASHFIVVDVCGFDSREAAVQVARAVADSALVKTAVTGNDPNWGRITSAAGYAGIEFDADCLTLEINGVTVYRNGVPVPYDEGALSAVMAEQDVHLRLELTGGPRSGSSQARLWTSDLTQEYVRLNSEYTT